MIIHKLSIYDHDNYAYDGLAIKEEVYFIHPALAKAYASANGLEIVNYPVRPNQATLEDIDVVEC